LGGTERRLLFPDLNLYRSRIQIDNIAVVDIVDYIVG